MSCLLCSPKLGLFSTRHSCAYPSSHEKPTDPDDPLANQNLKDRFYGVNDPVADKLIKRYDEMPKLKLPDDKTITALYVGGLPPDATEQELRYALQTLFSPALPLPFPWEGEAAIFHKLSVFREFHKS